MSDPTVVLTLSIKGNKIDVSAEQSVMDERGHPRVFKKQRLLWTADPKTVGWWGIGLKRTNDDRPLLRHDSPFVDKRIAFSGYGSSEDGGSIRSLGRSGKKEFQYGIFCAKPGSNSALYRDPIIVVEDPDGDPWPFFSLKSDPGRTLSTLSSLVDSLQEAVAGLSQEQMEEE